MKSALRLLAFFLGFTINSLAELIVDQVPLSLLNAPAGKSNTVTTVSTTQTSATRRQTGSTGDRWVKFEADFGITDKDAAPVKGSLQAAKYQLDQTTFVLQEFVKNVEDQLRFDYGVRDFSSAPTTPKSSRLNSGNILLDTLNATRFQSDINLQTVGRQFVGVKLVLPLGN
ncbi:MAG: hypothetical protein WCS70_01720 [Verrucomicrobiota bacterium]